MEKSLKNGFYSDEFGAWSREGDRLTLRRYWGGKRIVRIPAECTEIGSRAFSFSDVEEVLLHKNVSVLEPYAFAECPDLKRVVLPHGILRIEEGTFLGCTSLQEVCLPDGLRYIGRSAFQGCTALREMGFPGSLEMIDQNAFMAAGLEKLVLSGVCVIGLSAFEGCQWLRDAQIRAEWIDPRAFYGCGKLENLMLLDGLMAIGTMAFWGCAGLKTVHIPGSVYELGPGAFDKIPGLTVYAPGELREYLSHFRSFDVLEDDVRFFDPTSKVCYDENGGE